MIVVDSSVWIDFLNGRNAPHVRRLREILGIDDYGPDSFVYRKPRMAHVVQYMAVIGRQL